MTAVCVVTLWVALSFPLAVLVGKVAAHRDQHDQ